MPTLLECDDEDNYKENEMKSVMSGMYFGTVVTISSHKSPSLAQTEITNVSQWMGAGSTAKPLANVVKCVEKHCV